MTAAVASCLKCGYSLDGHQADTIAAHIRTEHKASPGLYLTVRLDGKPNRGRSCGSCAKPVFADEPTCITCGTPAPF